MRTRYLLLFLVVSGIAADRFDETAARLVTEINTLDGKAMSRELAQPELFPADKANEFLAG